MREELVAAMDEASQLGDRQAVEELEQELQALDDNNAMGGGAGAWEKMPKQQQQQMPLPQTPQAPQESPKPEDSPLQTPALDTRRQPQNLITPPLTSTPIEQGMSGKMLRTSQWGL